MTDSHMISISPPSKLQAASHLQGSCCSPPCHLGINETTMTTAEGGTPSCISILGLGWKRLKTGFYNSFCQEADKKNTRPCGVNFLKGVSILQITLGFSCICLALVGLSAAFSTREEAAMSAFYNLRWDMRKYYQDQVMNVTKQALAERDYMIEFYRKSIRNIKANNCTSYDDNFPPSTKLQGYNSYGELEPREVPDFCDNRYDSPCNPRGGIERYHLIIDYLGVPGWAGIMLIITGLVGLKMVHVWEKFEYLQVSSSYTILNILSALVFAPGMLAVGILQIVFSDYWEVGFRNIVGRVTVGFAGVILILSIIVCVVNCCCPVKPSRALYEKLVADEKDKEKQHEQGTIVA